MENSLLFDFLKTKEAVILIVGYWIQTWQTAEKSFNTQLLYSVKKKKKKPDSLKVRVEWGQTVSVYSCKYGSVRTRL